jgi:hypothetical protein
MQLKSVAIATVNCRRIEFTPKRESVSINLATDATSVRVGATQVE